MRQLASSDPLTGLANYRRLVEFHRFRNQALTPARTHPFAILLLDLDHLKKINDTYGHLVGSRALCRLADILRLHSREIDLVARYGGDEFVVVLPETEAESALLIAQRISDSPSSTTRGSPRSPPAPASPSTPPTANPSMNSSIAADRALYRDKSSSKPRIHVPLYNLRSISPTSPLHQARFAGPA